MGGMAPRPHWWHTLQSSKNEAILAIDLYNRSGSQRQLEAYVVHMSIAWLRLLQAKCEKDGGDLYVRDKKTNRRVREKDGDWRMKPLSTLVDELLPPMSPVSVNLDFFTQLRNRIEHRFEKDIAALVAGRTQAHLLNYEQTLVAWFGDEESVASELRFPLFVSTLTGDAVTAVKEVSKRVPRAIREWVRDYDALLDPEVAADQAFDFRIYLIPQTGPKTSADAAMTFVKLEDLSEDQRAAIDRVQTIIKNKKVPVANLDKLKPSEVARELTQRLGHPVTINDHTCAWRHFKARPPTGDPHPERTNSDFCVWDGTFKQHIYTRAWVEYLSRQLTDPDKFEAICGRSKPAPASATPQSE